MFVFNSEVFNPEVFNFEDDDGALELSQAGLTVYVAIGVAMTWLFLFLGDLADDDEDEVDGGEGSAQNA